MTTALIHLRPQQKIRLQRRARRRGNSFSQEVRDAIDLYLEVPVETRELLSALASEANASLDRMISQLDGSIAIVDRVLKRAGRRQ